MEDYFRKAFSPARRRILEWEKYNFCQVLRVFMRKAPKRRNFKSRKPKMSQSIVTEIK